MGYIGQHRADPKSLRCWVGIHRYSSRTNSVEIRCDRCEKIK